MGRNIGTGCILLGIVMLLGAAVRFGGNEMESIRAGELARTAAAILRQQPKETVPSEGMPIAELDGYGYIGTVTIPKLQLELAVMDRCDEARLKLAPCRYSGSTLTDNLVLAGHNYRSHFGPIRRLSPGDEITFTDVGGNVTRYRVAAVETIPATAVEDTVSGAYDLTLLTCTYGGQDRIRVRCRKMEEPS